MTGQRERTRRCVGVILAAVLWTGCATFAGQPASDPSRASERESALRLPGAPRRVVLISVAGLETPDFLNAWGYVASAGDAVRMPALAVLAREGVVGERARPPTPSAPYASHATIVTGQLPVRHGIVADTSLDQSGMKALPFWDSRLLRGTPLWDAAIGRGVMALGWPTTSGARIELIVPDSRPDDPIESWLDHQRRVASPPLYRELLRIAEQDGVAPPVAGSDGEEGDAPESNDSGRTRRSWPTPAERDAAFAELACQVAGSERDPGLWLIRLAQTERLFETRGYGSVEVDRALGRVDRAIERIVGCLEAKGRLADTALFVVGDVTYRPVHTRIDPNVALHRHGLVGRDPRAKTGVRSWLAIARSHGRSASVYARDVTHAVTAREVLEAEAERTGAFRVVAASDLAKAGGDPQAWFGLSAAPGFVFGDGLTRPALRPAEQRSAAGGLPFLAARDSAVGFVAWGRGIRSAVRVPELSLADVAPTIAALLGVRLDDEIDGEPLIGILRASVPPPPPGPKRLGVGQGEDVDRTIRDLGGSRPGERRR